MIIPNGTIEFKTSSGSLDEDGFPQESEKTYGDPIICQYVNASQNLVQKSDGEVTRYRSWAIYIEQRPISGDIIRLKDRDGVTVGVYQIKSVEPLDAVDEIRLFV